ncbi:MAG: DNA-binding domain-containing protein [Asticcacaulis sp.]
MRFDVRDLATFQNDFLWAITTPTASYDPGLVIHRDTGFFGLLDGLCDIYEATRKALGDEAFKAFARDFIRAHPLTSGDRNAYGGGFRRHAAIAPAPAGGVATGTWHISSGPCTKPTTRATPNPAYSRA